LQKHNKIDEHVTGQSKPNNSEWRDIHFFLSFFFADAFVVNYSCKNINFLDGSFFIITSFVIFLKINPSCPMEA